MPGRLLPEPAAAEFLGLTRNQIRHLRSTRQIPFVYVGRRVMYDTRALDRWIETHTIPARP